MRCLSQPSLILDALDDMNGLSVYCTIYIRQTILHELIQIKHQTVIHTSFTLLGPWCKDRAWALHSWPSTSIAKTNSIHSIKARFYVILVCTMQKWWLKLTATFDTSRWKEGCLHHQDCCDRSLSPPPWCTYDTSAEPSPKTHSRHICINAVSFTRSTIS